MTIEEKLELQKIINCSNLSDEKVDRFNVLLKLALKEAEDEKAKSIAKEFKSIENPCEDCACPLCESCSHRWDFDSAVLDLIDRIGG